MRALPVLASLALAAAPAAQLELVRTGGVLGATTTYDLAGDAGELYFLIVSKNAGPVPLSIVDPSDPRVLEVGLDLPAFWRVGSLDGAGLAAEAYAIPGQPVLVGLELHAQALTIFGATTVVDDLSEPTAVALGLPGDVLPAVGERVVPTRHHGASVLPDGRVLLSGGVEETAAAPGAAVASLEVFDPQTQGFTALAAALQHPRAHHTALRLQDDRVLLLGGIDETGAVVATGDVFDPATGLVAPIAPMASPRALHTATELADGRVLVAGGATSFAEGEIIPTADAAVASTELYDPAADVWTAGPNLPERLSGHAAALLPSGRVLLLGGIEADQLFGFPLLRWTTACHLYDPASDAILQAAALPSGRSRAAALATAAGALASGGERPIGLEWQILDETVAYDEAADAWTALGALGAPRSRHELLVAGTRLVVAGGIADVDSGTGLGIGESLVETAPLDGSAWTAAGNLALPRPGGRASAIEDGLRVLVTGAGEGAASPPDASADVLVTP